MSDVLYYSALREPAKDGALRIVIFGVKEDRTYIDRLAEGGEHDLQIWFAEQDNVTHVRLPDGSDDEPDCLTVWEAMESAYA